MLRRNGQRGREKQANVSRRPWKSLLQAGGMIILPAEPRHEDRAVGVT